MTNYPYVYTNENAVFNPETKTHSAVLKTPNDQTYDVKAQIFDQKKETKYGSFIVGNAIVNGEELPIWENESANWQIRWSATVVKWSTYLAMKKWKSADTNTEYQFTISQKKEEERQELPF